MKLNLLFSLFFQIFFILHSITSLLKYFCKEIKVNIYNFVR